ncbi:MAG: Uncharacterised protein [Porticoccaceae bacterium UBA1117]|nr:MAG: Uncharacterised protein [Porticoccaceae bacterium UBA1117]
MSCERNKRVERKVMYRGTKHSHSLYLQVTAYRQKQHTMELSDHYYLAPALPLDQDIPSRTFVDIYYTEA